MGNSEHVAEIMRSGGAPTSGSSRAPMIRPTCAAAWSRVTTSWSWWRRPIPGRAAGARWPRPISPRRRSSSARPDRARGRCSNAPSPSPDCSPRRSSNWPRPRPSRPLSSPAPDPACSADLAVEPEISRRSARRRPDLGRRARTTASSVRRSGRATAADIRATGSCFVSSPRATAGCDGPDPGVDRLPRPVVRVEDADHPLRPPDGRTGLQAAPEDRPAHVGGWPHRPNQRRPCVVARGWP